MLGIDRMSVAIYSRGSGTADISSAKNPSIAGRFYGAQATRFPDHHASVQPITRPAACPAFLSAGAQFILRMAAALGSGSGNADG